MCTLICTSYQVFCFFMKLLSRLSYQVCSSNRDIRRKLPAFPIFPIITSSMKCCAIIFIYLPYHSSQVCSSSPFSVTQFWFGIILIYDIWCRTNYLSWFHWPRIPTDEVVVSCDSNFFFLYSSSSNSSHRLRVKLASLATRVRFL